MDSREQTSVPPSLPAAEGNAPKPTADWSSADRSGIVGAGGQRGNPLRQFPCQRCGAKLEFKPGSETLVCPYCTHTNTIQSQLDSVDELDYAEYLQRLARAAPQKDTAQVECQGCHAMVEVPKDTIAFDCPFCTKSIVTQALACTVIRPEGILPFELDKTKAEASFRVWLSSRWFAPSALKHTSKVDGQLKGLYIPAWTYDSATTTAYRGQRGDAYYVTQTYMVNGRPQTRQVRKIRWTSASGTVNVNFDDVLVEATKGLSKPELDTLRPWGLKNVQPYADEYLAGFRAECYQVPLHEGFEIAKIMMEPRIRSTICADIGGDEQRIDSTKTVYRDITFKHLLLPVWLSAYRFQGRVFRFLVNARTGTVYGQRPYSAIKITLFVLMCLVIVTVLVLLLTRS